MWNEKLEQLAARLNQEADVSAEVGDDVYLLRFSIDEAERNNLVVMSDLGVTWEPCRAYSTPRYCSIDLDDIEAAAQKLIRVARAYSAGELPLDVWEGEGAAENL